MSKREMPETQRLRYLARLYGVQPNYYDVFGRLIEPPAEALLSVLRILGAQASTMSDVTGAVRERREFLYRQVLDPVTIVWDGGPAGLKLRLPSALADVTAEYTITLESGETIAGALHDDAALKPVEREVEGARYVTRPLELKEALPLGYHRLHVQIRDLNFDSHLFSTRSRVFAPQGSDSKQWGVFCPLYAVASDQSWSTGDFSVLGGLVDFVGEMGGHAVGTLPLFAAFLDEPFNPSPYAPVSRLFWNELYLDVTRIAELGRCVGARSIIGSAEFQSELAALRADKFVDYRRVMVLKRKVLHELLRCILKRSSERRNQFERFAETHPAAQDYAAFRAKTEAVRKPWQQWDTPSRDGVLKSGEYVENIKQYHLYVQWQCEEQMRALGDKTKAGGPALYLDFPLGVNRDGYDVWREREAFALAASGGAPPDEFFTKGQDWGFPPLHPEGLRHQGYRYYIDCVRRHLQYAKKLRIDHVMGLHRLYWVPEGFAPTDGVYVRYPAEEFYAVLLLESNRSQAQIVGENLGTVAVSVHAAMERHGLCGMHVSQFGVRPGANSTVDKPEPRTVASLNTHDTPTFAAFWSGADIDDRIELGLIDRAKRDSEHDYRRTQREALLGYLRASRWLGADEEEPEAVLRAWLYSLAESEAEFLLVNLEDLWLEPAPQNVPGTWTERPNWKRKSRFSLEQIRRMAEFRDVLKTIDEKRKTGR